MRFNKQIAVILVLSSLLISAIGAALFLYYENENTKKANDMQVTVFIAKKDIKKDSLIKKDDIKKTVIAKRYLLTKPLLQKEIVNKFAKDAIYKNEMFRKEKISGDIGETDAKILAFKYNSYNISFKLFSNPNYALNKGDIINIISVYPRSKDKNNMNYSVKYVAKAVKVLGFLEKGKIVEKGVRKVKRLVKTKNKKLKEPKYELINVFANEIVLDISDKIILSTINDYNKGKQLWMVKTNQVLPKIKKPSKKPTKKRVKKSYPYKMYLPKSLSQTRTGVIQYKDSSIGDISHNAVISSNSIQECLSQNKVVIGISKKVLLHSIPSLNGKIKKILYKNYIIPYKKKINSIWYETCDGQYIHKNELREITYNKVKSFSASSTCFISNKFLEH